MFLKRNFKWELLAQDNEVSKTRKEKKKPELYIFGYEKAIDW